MLKKSWRAGIEESAARKVFLSQKLWYVSRCSLYDSRAIALVCATRSFARPSKIEFWVRGEG